MVVVMLCYARSGGTLLNRCLGSLPNVIIMSEISANNVVNPDAPNLVKQQALQWYGIELNSTGLLDNILELERYCTQNGKKLIVRDWSINNFAEHKFNNYDPPGRFLILDLLKEHCGIKPFAFVRDAVDVWISRSMKKVDVFFPPYLCYVRALKELGVPIFKYEDFCSDPARVLEQICEYTGIQFVDVTNSYHGFKKVTGDNDKSRGWRQNEIRPLPRKSILKKKKYALANCIEMRQCNELLGYEPYNYDEGRFRWWFDCILSKVKNTFNK